MNFFFKRSDSNYQKENIELRKFLYSFVDFEFNSHFVIVNNCDRCSIDTIYLDEQISYSFGSKSDGNCLIKSILNI